MEETELGEVSSLLAKGSGVIAFGLLAGSIFNYLTRIVIARYFGSSAYGLISLGFAFASFMITVSLLGFFDGVSRNTAYYKERGDQAGIKGVLLSSLKLSLPLSVLIAGLVYVSASEIATTIFHNASLAPILQIFAIFVPFYVLLSIISANFRGLKHAKYKVYTYNLLLPSSKLALASVFILFGFKVVEVAWSYPLAVIFASAAAIYLLLTKVFPQVANLKSKDVTRKLLRFSWPLMVSHVLTAVNRYLGIILLGLIKSSESVGIFNAALPSAYLIFSAYMVFDFLYLPLMSELYSSDRSEMLKKFYKLATRWVMTITLPLLFLFLFLPTTLLTSFFGSEYAVGAGALSSLAVGHFLLAFTGPSANLLTVIGKTKVRLVFFLLTSIFCAVLSLLLIPAYGVSGAGTALSIALSLGSVLILVYLYKYLGFSPFSKLMLRAILAALIASPLLFFLPTGSIISLIFSSFAFFLVYACLLLAVRAYNRTDLETMEQLLSSLGIKNKQLNALLVLLENRADN